MKNLNQQFTRLLREKSLKGYTTKAILALLVILFYFNAWQHVRGWVTEYAAIPVIEYAQKHCEAPVYYHQNKKTSTNIFIYNFETEEYATYAYTTPAGFFLLAGLLFVILLNGTMFHIRMLLWFHFPFWALSILFIGLGLCVQELFFHLVMVGTRYITQLYTFLILALLISPGLREKLKLEHN